MKTFSLLIAMCLSVNLFAQQLYDNFETGFSSPIQYSYYTGVTAFNAANPLSGGTGNCMQIEKVNQWDAIYIKAKDNSTFQNVTPYLTGSATKKFTFRIYSPVAGVVCKAQLRKSSATGTGNNGVLAELYSIPTTKVNTWDTVTFVWAWAPDQTILPTEIDELMIVVANKGDNPNEPDGVGQVIYIDDITGPELAVGTGINDTQNNQAFLLNNYPNPSISSTTVSYLVPEAGYVSLNVYDLNGKLVQEVVNGYLTGGLYQNEVYTTDLAKGLYIYTLTIDHVSASSKLIVK